MRIRNLHLFLAALALLGAAQTASAQSSPYAVFNPYPSLPPTTPAPQQPLLSPYLSLLNGGNPAVQFYLNVEPMLQKQNQQFLPAITDPNLNPQLIQQNKDREEFIAITGITPQEQTGHPTAFSVYRGYRLPARGYIPYSPPAGTAFRK